MARAVAENEELADVVVASDVKQARQAPWYITLRPWLFCLAFLAVLELGARWYFDATPSLQRDRFDNFPSTATLDAFVRQIRSDKAYRVVVIGDSVVVGPSLLESDQTIPRYLEAELQRRVPDRPVHVWNLAIAGARATDQYCLLQRVLQAKPDFVVVEANYFISELPLEEIPLFNPWLARDLPTVPADLRPYVGEHDAKQRFEDGMTDLVERNVRFLGLRQAINAKLFGVQPRVPFGTPNPVVMSAVAAGKRLGHLQMTNWHERGFDLTSFRNTYSARISPEGINGRFYRLIAAALHRSGVPSLAYSTPQNPAITLAYVPPARYAENKRTLASFFADPAVTYRDYTDVVPTELFYDNDHMMAGGNHALAAAMAADMAARVQAACRSRR